MASRLEGLSPKKYFPQGLVLVYPRTTGFALNVRHDDPRVEIRAHHWFVNGVKGASEGGMIFIVA